MAVQDRSRVLDDVVDLRDVGLEIADDRLRRVNQPLQGRTQPAHGSCRLVEQRADLVLGQRGKPPVSGIQRRPDLTGHRALGDGLSGREELARIPARHQVQKLLTDRGHRMHVRNRIDRDFVAAVDAHGRFGALFGWHDVGDLADGDAAIGHVGRRIQATRCGQLGLERIPTDAHQAWNLQVVHTQNQQRDHRHDAEQPQLASDEGSQQFLSPLSISGPPGASFGFGVKRTSGIIVSGSRPNDCSSARKAPDNPVPVRNALSMAL